MGYLSPGRRGIANAVGDCMFDGEQLSVQKVLA
jgi:hypothetical protein